MRGGILCLQNNHASLNVSHTVHSLSFGPPFPGVVNPLDNNERMLSKVRTPLLSQAKLVCESWQIRSGPVAAHPQQQIQTYATPARDATPHITSPGSLTGGVSRAAQEEAGTFRYFLKVVPTVYSSLAGPEIPTNQFSVTEYFTPSKGKDGALPAVYFMYEPSKLPRVARGGCCQHNATRRNRAVCVCVCVCVCDPVLYPKPLTPHHQTTLPRAGTICFPSPWRSRSGGALWGTS